MIVNHQSQIASADVQKHTQLEYLGQIPENPSVQKAMYCPQVFFQQYVYVPGVCSSEEHHETGQSGCLCGTPGHMGCTPADEGFYIIQYGMLPAECGGGASPGNGPGSSPISTGPYNPGGGAPTANPCDKIKNPLVRNVLDVAPPTTVKGMLKHLKNNLPSANPQIKGEISYAMFQDSNNELHAQYFEQTSVDQQIEFSLGIGYIYPVYMHTHTVKGLTIFSLADIYAIKKGIENGSFNENTVFYLVTDNGTQYAMTITDLNSFTSWANGFFIGWEYDVLKDAREKDYEKLVTTKNTINQNENGLMNFFNTKFVGIQLFKASSDFTTWQQLSYNPITKKTVKTNCPN